MSRPLRALAALCLAFAGLIVPGAVRAGDPCFHRMDNRPPVSSGQTSQIAIGDCVFAPTVSRVPVGTTVTWTNGSIQSHEIVGSNLTWGAHDKLLQPGDAIGWTFDAPGVYAYTCMLHPGMIGAIIVGDASTATGAGPVAATDDKSSSATGGALGALAPAVAGGSLVALAGLALMAFRRRAAEGA